VYYFKKLLSYLSGNKLLVICVSTLTLIYAVLTRWVPTPNANPNTNPAKLY